MLIQQRNPFWFATINLVILFAAGCQTRQMTPPPPTSVAAKPSATAGPTATSLTPPLPTFDVGVQPYLENVEEILRHSAVVIKDRAVGIPDACASLYITAFPYSEPDRRGGMTLAVTGLKRRDDGSIIMGEHEYLWNLKGEGMAPERCKDVIIQDRSRPDWIQISFQVQDPYDLSWRIGVASGPCPGIDLWLAGYFFLYHPDDFQLWITQYGTDSPTDYWLRDGNQLLRYQWEPWQESLLWTLENIPGTIHELHWTDESLDVNQDGLPDLAITWNISGEMRTLYYSPFDTGFELIEDQ